MATKEKASDAFTAEEKAAMREHVKAEKAAARKAAKGETDLEPEVLAKIAELPEPDRSIAQRIHEIVKATAPSLTPRLYYGMPAFAKDGKVLCFFQPASKFKSRYSTFGYPARARGASRVRPSATVATLDWIISSWPPWPDWTSHSCSAARPCH